MPWDSSDRRYRLPRNWARLTAAVHRRSGGRCEFRLPSGRRCPRPADGGVDHIVPGDDHRMSNLRDSCAYHHGKKSSREGLAERLRRRDSGKREPERHPLGYKER